MNDESKQNGPAVAVCEPLEWHRGPAAGGGGTEGGGPKNSLWADGDRLLVVVYTKRGVEIDLISISCDQHFFSIYVGEDDPWGWDETCISWWAKITRANFPASEEQPDPVASHVQPC